MKPVTITPQKNEFDDHFLDVVGNEYKYDHAKGLAEWIKNSADAYSTTLGIKDAKQYILLRFRIGKPKRDSIFECIDFVGMTKENIDKALKIWGLPTAAKKGTSLATYGGHGNGGKFYMRQMFESARFITFRGGRLNVFGFAKKKYGYAKGFENVKYTLSEALKLAEIEMLEFPPDVMERWKKDPAKAGFTVVRGDRPERFSGRSSTQSIIENLLFHPQARRLLQHKQVYFVNFGEKWGKRILPPSIDPKPGFESLIEIPLPKKIEWEGEEIPFKSSKHSGGKLILRTSAEPLSRTSELAQMNSIDIIGELGCIGSYRMHELGLLRFSGESEFIYGECHAAFLEDEDLRSVKNDREKLVKNPTTDALLGWIRQQIDSLAEQMAEKRKTEQKTFNLKQSALYNQILDRWKNKFLTKLSTDIFAGANPGSTFGGTGLSGGGGGNAPVGGNGGSGDDGGRGGGDGKGTGTGTGGTGAGDDPTKPNGGSGSEKTKGPQFPRVLLSSYDRDPLSPTGELFACDERHPPVYQRIPDIDAGIYWINTSRPLAVRIMETFGSKDSRWREYLFQRYVDIILKTAIFRFGSESPNFTPTDVTNKMDDVISHIHDAAAADLDSFLFEEELTGTAAAKPTTEPQTSASAPVPDTLPSMGEMLG